MPYQLILSAHRAELERIVAQYQFRSDLTLCAAALSSLIQQIRHDIPSKKRIGVGQYSVIKELGCLLHERLALSEVPLLPFAAPIFTNPDADCLLRGLALQLISLHGLEELTIAWPFMLQAGAAQHWEIREFAAAFARKLLKKHPQAMKEHYLQLVHSADANLRRLVAESLRPVVENRWFQRDPQWPLEILQHLFQETDAYPRTSVGNNLSDWSRINPELVYNLVAQLIKSQDKNSGWIATRACRNLVKKEPLRVIDLLGVDAYHYKDRVYRRADIESQV